MLVRTKYKGKSNRVNYLYFTIFARPNDHGSKTREEIFFYASNPDG